MSQCAKLDEIGSLGNWFIGSFFGEVIFYE